MNRCSLTAPHTVMEKPCCPVSSWPGCARGCPPAAAVACLPKLKEVFGSLLMACRVCTPMSCTAICFRESLHKSSSGLGCAAPACSDRCTKLTPAAAHAAVLFRSLRQGRAALGQDTATPSCCKAKRSSAALSCWLLEGTASEGQLGGWKDAGVSANRKESVGSSTAEAVAASTAPAPSLLDEAGG